MGRRRCLRHVDSVCRRYRHLGMTPEKEIEFRNYLHECKDSGMGGSDENDYTDAELDELVRDFLGLGES